MLLTTARHLCTAAVLTIASLSLAASAHAASITLTGTTTGCFGSGCSDPAAVFGDQVSSGGVRFDGNTFTLQLDEAAPAAMGFLSGGFGTMERISSSITASTFTMKVDFTLVGGVSPDPGSVFATTAQTGVNASVDWQNVLSTFTFANQSGSGGFSFVIGDQTLNNGNPLRTIMPTFSAVSFVSAETAAAEAARVAAVPEPGSLLLLGSGLVLAASRMRRRKSSK